MISTSRKVSFRMADTSCQSQVALGVPMCIIDAFQGVHIAEKQQHGPVDAVCQLDFLFGQQGEAPPVIQPGQVIRQ